VEISRHDCSSCVAKRAPESAGTAEMFSDPCREILEIAERASVAGEEFALAVLDVGEGAKAVDLQFENTLVGIEGFNAA